MTKVYLASSWRNHYQRSVLLGLRSGGFDVYDFKNPSDNENGFSWKEIQPDYENWTTEEYIDILDHEISNRGFGFDWDAMQNADCGVLLLPCGRSAHIEAGYFVGARKPLYIYIPTETTEPELMYKMASGGVFASYAKLLDKMQRDYKRGVYYDL